MAVVIAILGAVLAFFLVVVLHEWGHFIVARFFGISVTRFSLGFGRPIWSYRAKSKVEYSIGWLPLGGYVKMAESLPLDANAKGTPELSSVGIPFETAPWFHRVLVLLAGPIMNFILAILLFSFVYMIGVQSLKPIVGTVMPHSIMAKAGVKSEDEFLQVGAWQTTNWQQVLMGLLAHMGDQTSVPVLLKGHDAPPVLRQLDLQQWQFDPMKGDIVQSLGISPYLPAIPAVIAEVKANSPASRAGLTAGMRITRIEHHRIHSWQEVMTVITANPGKTLMISTKYKRFKVRLDSKAGEGYLGVLAKAGALPARLMHHIQYPWYSAPYFSLLLTYRLAAFHLVLVKLLVSGHLSLKALSGPVAIFQTAGHASMSGFLVFLQFVALISVVLGVFNLLPIPALDGGQLLFCLAEGLLRRPLPNWLQVYLTSAGIILLISLIGYASVNDVLRIIHG